MVPTIVGDGGGAAESVRDTAVRTETESLLTFLWGEKIVNTTNEQLL